MESEVCMNELCGDLLADCKKGWPLKSGGFANLCNNCGTAYEQLFFCKLFHQDETGWRECNSCSRRLHCGCIASSAFLELLDNGGVSCVTCSNTLQHNPKGVGETDNNKKVCNFYKIVSTRLNDRVVQTNLTIGLSGKPVSFPDTAVEEKKLNRRFSSLQQGNLSSHVFTKSMVSPQGYNSNIGLNPQIRVKNQLLPRYWPRITEQELQQISGGSNATVVPLFEKVLSASDAGRIGRLVLPKACAEAYFPVIYEAEGIPLRIQDVKGKEWVFQFRFWPNNNSRMYVLEGVTPCIQSMQLQAGDTGQGI